ncbi:NUDIX domain-containing protein [Neobacillus rhizophilus]|uniref:NUDIX domain-containing protein n=1 Tax=Neobacillus rhizophilus TaxID=2833579 RepID=A0A942U366_9BACI|nr:NUDIX domain-containing protein [Neobacillus rhizophilus]MBS4213790.1 NUDIX domain-containing protein [Neobacillus rhizophilus]MBU8917804.1 NUDIX domain-containing protein [Bacillus sp. FJAT-29953]
MKQYVVGFAFNYTMDRVLMLKRSKPPYQYLYNGVGGKIEIGEDPVQAMFQELQEETGLKKSDIQISSHLTTLEFKAGVKLHVYYFVLNRNIEPYSTKKTMDEGTLEWLHIKNNHLLDASNPKMAGDGNIAYFLQFAQNEYKGIASF